VAEPDVRTLEGLIDSMTNRAPQDPEVVRIFEKFRESAHRLGEAIFEHVPEGRNRSMAITHLEDCVHRSIKAIALNQDEALAMWRSYLGEDA